MRKLPGKYGFSPISYPSSFRFIFTLIKVFWKGEFEGKNLFFKKGFPLIRLEKTSLKGSQLAGDRKFFQVSEALTSF